MVKTRRNNGNRIANLALLLIIALGLFMVSYPSVSDWWNARTQSQAIAGYSDEVVALDAGRRAQLLAEAQSYNEDLGEHLVDGRLDAEWQARYETTLDIVGEGIMGYLEIPSISCSLPIYHGTSEAVLQIAIGHVPWSSLPAGSAGGHCVLSGHSGLPNALLFTNLDQLREGDSFEVHVLGEELAYRVCRISTVLPDEVDSLQPVAQADLCTLVTCTPYGVNSHRLLVTGERVFDGEGQPALDAEEGEGEKMSWQRFFSENPWTIIFVLVLLVLAVCVWPARDAAHGATFLTAPTLNVSFGVEDAPMPNVEFRVYRVGIESSPGTFEVDEPFSCAWNAPAETRSTGAWARAAANMARFAKEHEAPVLACARTDELGIARFAGFAPGLYLVEGDAAGLSDLVAESAAADDVAVPVPFLVRLPWPSADGEAHGEADHPVTVLVKYELQPADPGASSPDSEREPGERPEDSSPEAAGETPDGPIDSRPYEEGFFSSLAATGSQFHLVALVCASLALASSAGLVWALRTLSDGLR